MSLPEQNAQAAKGLEQARTVQMQEQLRGIPAGVGGPGLAQKIGGQQAQQTGQIQLQQAQAGQTSAQLMGQMGLEGQAREQRQRGFEQQLTLDKNQQKISESLNNLKKDLGNKLLDQQLTFQKDSAGQTLLNERQLLDWAATKAESAEEFANYAQAMQQVSEREIQMMEMAHKKLTQALTQGEIMRGKKLDRALQKELVEKKRALELEIEKKKNAAANRASIFQAVGTVAGAGLGAYLGAGTPTGAATGAAVGGSLGQGLGTAVSGLNI